MIPGSWIDSELTHQINSKRIFFKNGISLPSDLPQSPRSPPSPTEANSPKYKRNVTSTPCVFRGRLRGFVEGKGGLIFEIAKQPKLNIMTTETDAPVE